MKIKILLFFLLLSNCVNIGDHYGIPLCNDKACGYKPYEGRGSAILETKYDFDYTRVLKEAINKSNKHCLVGYSIISDSFPEDQEVFNFNWEKDIQADYILYIRLETTNTFIMEAPFKTIPLKANTINYTRKALIYFYVDKSRAINCYKYDN